ETVLRSTMKELRIEHLLDRSIFELSGGEKQIISIASAYASGTEIVLLDEPTSNLDAHSIRAIASLLAKLKACGRTIIIAEHRLHFLADLADHVLYVDQGRIEHVWNAEEFFSMPPEQRKSLGLRSPEETETDLPKLSSAAPSLASPPQSGLFVERLDCHFQAPKQSTAPSGGLLVKNLHIPLGSIVGIVGRNGLGKSTFVRSLMGLEPHAQALIHWNGNTLSSKERTKLSYLVMQDVTHQLFTESVRSEVELGMSSEFTQKDVDAILQKLGILELADKHPMSLSGGQKQRVAIAAAILSGAKILCFDEPTSGMDYESMMSISHLIREFRRPDLVILIISHDREFLNETVDSVIDLTQFALRGIKGGSMISKILSYAKQKKKNFYLSIALILCSSLLWIGAFLSAYALIDGLIAGSLDPHSLLTYGGILFVSLFFHSLFKSMGLKHSHLFAYHALGEMRQNFADKLLHNPLGSTMRQTAGSYRTKIVDSIEQIEILLAHAFPEGIPHITTSLVIFALLFLTDLRIGLLALVPFVASFVFMAKMFQNSMKKMVQYYEASKNMSSNIVEYISGIEVIKIFNRKDTSYEKVTRSVFNYRDFTLGWFRESWNTMAICFSLAPTVILLALPFGILFHMQGSLSLSKLILMSLLCFAATAPLSKVQVFFPILAQLHQKINDLERDFYAEPLQCGEEELPDQPGTIEFDQVRFSYDATPVINRADFHIAPGQKVAFVGESGSGKSTLAKLLMHYYDVDAGAIRIGGKALTDLRLESLMSKISYVSQDNFLFDVSIRENILLGNPNATEEQMIAAAKAAHIHDFIVTLERGYDTRVGDSGNKLSGGEKQRICIARAIIKDAPIVILDEATSYTDPENEYYIEKAIRELLRDKTVIIIAHKLSKIKHCDRVILIDAGTIAAIGTHEELLSHPLYANLWNRYISAKQFEFKLSGGGHE
ncbi:MAG: ATP-binding cassette domain-containing protein, partial [Bacillota bacterium]|nr:ATP-binding cassette domain-containing protein [Bacillota bacterium]